MCCRPKDTHTHRGRGNSREGRGILERGKERGRATESAAVDAAAAAAAENNKNYAK